MADEYRLPEGRCRPSPAPCREFVAGISHPLQRNQHLPRFCPDPAAFFLSPSRRPAVESPRAKEARRWWVRCRTGGRFGASRRRCFALALVAERAAGRSFPVRFLVLAVLGRAEAIARAFVAREIAADWPDAPCLDEPPVFDTTARPTPRLLALRLRMLAAMLGMLADADACCDDGSVLGPAGPVPRPSGAACCADPILLLVFATARPRSCRSPPQGGRKRSASPPPQMNGRFRGGGGSQPARRARPSRSSTSQPPSRHCTSLRSISRGWSCWCAPATARACRRRAAG
jgi:hypothetical protein